MHDILRLRILSSRFFLPFLLLGITCLGFSSCARPQREARRTDVELEPGWAKGDNYFREASYRKLTAAVPQIEDAEYVDDDELCATCHEVYTKTFQDNVHRGVHTEGHACEACHGPASRHLQTRGQEPGLILSFASLQPAQASEVCLKCHEQDACSPGAQWRTSVHAHRGVSCLDCHNAHYNVPPGTSPTTEPGQTATLQRDSEFRLAGYQDANEADGLPSLGGTSNNLGAVSPNVCYKCHQDMREFQEIAGPHQICGPNGFNCTTCHDAHGKLKEYSRQELCLQCHQEGSPTMAWHSSTHSLMGVACTDCHNPHPRTQVQRFFNTAGTSLTHTHISRPNRRMMSVQDPETCYKCHPKIQGLTSLPSHHPIREGKMLCSDCHDAHGQMEGNIKAEHVNLLCWKCHADKQGPFAYEHPPVTEDCGYCHNPHGTVANNLLHQPVTFLCLRCHTGHRQNLHGHSNHGQVPLPNGPGARADIDQNPGLRQAFYTDCTQCHTQIHGSDLPSAGLTGGMFR